MPEMIFVTVILSTCLAIVSTLAIVNVEPSLPKITSFTFRFVENFDRTRTLKLECVAKGNPPANVTFQKNGNKLQQPIRQEGDNKYVVLVQDVSYRRGDDGRYRCVAGNKIGLVFEEKLVKIEVMGAFFQPPNKSATWKTLTIGRPYTLFCPGHSHTFPKTLSWGAEVKAGQHKTLQEDSERMVLPDGSLYFPHVTKELVDRMKSEFKWGVSCVLESSTNHGGHVEHQRVYSNKFIFRVHPTNVHTNDIRPLIESSTRIPARMYLAEGERMTLTCAGGGNPRPTVTWYHEGVQITNIDKYFEFNTYQPQKLTIVRMRRHLQGEYKCVYENRAGIDQTKGKLYLAAPPEMKTSISDKQPEHDSEFELNCAAVGTKPIKYEWYRNGKRLTTHTSENSTTTVEEGRLHIQRLNYKHQGSYQCIARNKFGYRYGVANVRVMEPKVIEARRVDTNTARKRPTGDSNNNAGDAEATTGLSTTMLIIIISIASVILLVIVVGVTVVCRTRDCESAYKPSVVYNTQQQPKPYEPGTYDHTRASTEIQSGYATSSHQLPPPPPGFTHSVSSCNVYTEDSDVESSVNGGPMRDARDQIDYEFAKRSPIKEHQQLASFHSRQSSISSSRSFTPIVPPTRHDSLTTSSTIIPITPYATLDRKRQAAEVSPLVRQNSSISQTSLSRDHLVLSPVTVHQPSPALSRQNSRPSTLDRKSLDSYATTPTSTIGRRSRKDTETSLQTSFAEAIRIGRESLRKSSLESVNSNVITNNATDSEDSGYANTDEDVVRKNFPVERDEETTEELKENLTDLMQEINDSIFQLDIEDDTQSSLLPSDRNPREPVRDWGV